MVCYSEAAKGGKGAEGDSPLKVTGASILVEVRCPLDGESTASGHFELGLQSCCCSFETHYSGL